MYYNFWWARASYLRGLVQPVQVDSAHEGLRLYYEEWLALREGAASEGRGGVVAERPSGTRPEPPARMHGAVWSNCSDCWSLVEPEQPWGTCWSVARAELALEPLA